MVDLDGKQLLYWDERESPGYGININPKPHDLEFKRCWKAVNHLGVVALPDEGEVVKERVQIPKSWHLTQPNTASAHTKAMDHSDFVFVCEVVDEGPLGHGNNAVQKSYRVRYPETPHQGLVGIDLPGEIWIHFDSTRYPDVPKSGFESAFHKGDTFIAFLDYVDKGQFQLQIVRIDKTDLKEQIAKAIKDHRANDHRPRPPQPTESDRGRAWWKQLEDRDAKLLTQFEQITVGMSPNQVRGLMGMDAQVKRDNLWGFKLSQASDTPNEVDWVLLVAFENGKVSSKQTTYTCLDTTVRE